jgi:hypothetical protein
MTSRKRTARAGAAQGAGGANHRAGRSLLELTGTTRAEHLPDGRSGNASAINGTTVAAEEVSR